MDKNIPYSTDVTIHKRLATKWSFICPNCNKTITYTTTVGPIHLEVFHCCECKQRIILRVDK